MVRPRVRLNQIPQEANLSAMVADLQRQLLEQQQEKNRLREQLANLNWMPHAGEVPPGNNAVPPVAPPAPEGNQGIPRNPEVLIAPVAPAGMQAVPPMVREDVLYERFRRMKAPEFEGLMDPIEADNWLIDIQVILDLMGLTEQEKVLYASFALKKDARHWWRTVQLRRDVTNMSWQDFVKEFRLARLCPELIRNETEKVRRMMKMFRIDIAKQVSAGSSPPTLVSDCISRAIRAEYWINQDREARAQIFKAKKEDKAVLK
ncbi:hypothetical protein TIFTF001_034208 [Ficus carica]|uniref:Retrotransposon gag domain-containing protein n=1 Tax=Ficus carica TaxID=3494 RepID=A0AA88JAC1_FICCA|nr:hypothetical protein TIFTF001_034208 [Ficus carica]